MCVERLPVPSAVGGSGATAVKLYGSVPMELTWYLEEDRLQTTWKVVTSSSPAL